MIFLKNAFCSDKHAIMSDCVSSPEINSISLGEGEYKNLYVSDIIEEKRGPQNLITMPYDTPSGTVSNGITYTINEDGSIHALGTLTGTSRFLIKDYSNGYTLNKDGVWYDFTCCPQGVLQYQYATLVTVDFMGEKETCMETGDQSVTLRGGDTNKIGLSIVIHQTIMASDDIDIVFKPRLIEWTEDDKTYILPEEWDEEHTKMWAKYENNTLAANNEIFNLASTDHLVIKRREKEGDPWTTIFVKETNTAEDFVFEFKDYYARSGVDYEYRLVSYSNGEPNMYMNITDEDGNNYRSEFKGYYIANKDNIYGTYYNVDGMNTTRNIINQTLQLLNNKYMNVVSNGLTNADTGTFTGTFIKFDDNGLLIEEGRQLRKNVMDTLTSRKPLILKLDDGRIWAIKVTGTPTDSSDSHPDVRTISFDWAEIGNPNDSETLYKLGLTNTDGRWW